MTARRSTTVAAACAVALALIATSSAATAVMAPGQRRADGTNIEVVNRNYALVASRGLPHDAERAQATLLEAISSVPRAVRGYFVVGDLSTDELAARRFTFTAVADQACLSWSSDGERSRTQGPCTSAEALRSDTPLRDAGTVLGFSALDAGRENGIEGLADALRVGSLKFVAGLMAPPTSRVTGLTDRDEDHLDDDGRITFRRAGDAVCVQLPVHLKAEARVVSGACSDLADRSTHWLVGWGWEDYVERMGRRLAKTFRAYSADHAQAYGKFAPADVRAIRTSMPGDGLALARRGPATYRLESPRHCLVVLTADPAGVGTAIDVSAGACN
jgi:hypothetical protein